MLSSKMTSTHTPLRINPPPYPSLFNTFHTPIFGRLQPAYFQQITHSSENNPGYTLQGESQAKPHRRRRDFRLTPYSPAINLAVTRVRPVPPYDALAQIHRNKIPYRASELLNNEIQGRRTWPIDSKAK